MKVKDLKKILNDIEDEEEIIIFIMNTTKSHHIYNGLDDIDMSLRLENFEYLIDKMNIVSEELDDIKFELKKELYEVL